MAIGVLVFSFLLMSRLTGRMDREIENYRKGEEGEQRTLEIILQSLDGNWTLFHNLRLPGRNKADLDAVLVGPAGLWVLEVKNLTGEYRNTGEKWEYLHKKRWIPYRNSPSRQAASDAARLGKIPEGGGGQAVDRARHRVGGPGLPAGGGESQRAGLAAGAPAGRARQPVAGREDPGRGQAEDRG